MNACRHWRRLLAGVALALLTAVGPAHAAGPPSGKGGPSTPPGKGKAPFVPPGHQSAPPSNSPLPPPTVIGTSTAGTTPFAWVDDANLLPAGAAALMVSMVRWQGSDASELDVPVVGVAVGLAPRVQLAASVPHVMGNEVNGVVGGLGTTFVAAKIGLIQRSAVKLAVAPTIEVLGSGVLQFLEPGESRVQVGVPVSVEIDQGSGRAFASAGFFTRGIRFVGGGVGVAASPRVSVSASFSHAWVSDSSFAAAAGASSTRNELSGTVSIAATSHVGVFGSIGHTIATSDANGAGLTVGGGVWLLVAPPKK